MKHNESAGAEVAAWVGLDWSDNHHVVCLQMNGSSEIEENEVAATPEGLQQWVVQLGTRLAGKAVAIAVEQTRGAVIYGLMKYPFIRLYPVAPASLSSYRRAFYPSGAKSDPVDGQLLLEMVRDHGDRLRVWEPEDEQTRALQLLTEHRRDVVDETTRLRNRITSLLKQYYPQALQWAGGLDTVQACDFLQRWPTLQQVQKARPEQLRRFYTRHGCRRRQLMERRIEEIGQAQALTEDRAIVQSLSQSVRTWVGCLKSLLMAIKEYDKRIEQLFEQHPDYPLFAPLPGAGQALAPRLLGAFGSNRDRFELADEVQQLSGIAPVTDRSGKKLWVHFRWACPHFMRQTFHEFANQSRRRCPWAQAVYEQHRARGKDHHAAVRALAYKWIRILFRCWKDGVPYDEQIYMASLRLRNPSLWQSAVDLVARAA